MKAVMKLQFPSVADQDKLQGAAFNNALAAGLMVRDTGANKFWACFEYRASDVEDGKVVADWFYSRLSNVWTRVPREGGSE